eukprot:gene15257-16832_t
MNAEPCEHGVEAGGKESLKQSGGMENQECGMKGNGEYVPLQAPSLGTWSSVKNGTATVKWTISSPGRIHVCSSEGDISDSYVTAPYIATHPAKEIKITLRYYLQDCNLFNSRCSYGIGLYVKRMDSPYSSINPRNQQFHFAGFFTNTTSLPAYPAYTKFTSTINVEMEGRKGLYLSFRDRGICGAILGLNVNYTLCPTLSRDLVQFQETPAPNSSVSVEQINGSCVNNAIPVPSSFDISMNCYSNGTAMFSGKCHCKKGHERIGNNCNGCNLGYYKATAGNERCKKCGDNTEHFSSAFSCPCKQYTYRLVANQHNSSENCYYIPSKPKNVKFTDLTSSSATITWDKPTFVGTLPIFYLVKCSNKSLYCNDVRYTPSHNVTVERVSLSQLKPFVHYQFIISSGNLVSEKAGKKNEQAINFVTSKGLPSDVSEINASIIGNLITLMWTPPLFKGDVTVSYDVSCVGFKMKETFYPVTTFTVANSGILICQVRAKNSIGLGKWVKKGFAVILDNEDPTKPPPTVFDPLIILYIALGIIALCIILTSACFIRRMRKKRNARNRAIPPIQWSTFSRHDPHLYDSRDNTYDPIKIPSTRSIQTGAAVNIGVVLDDDSDPLYLEIEDAASEYSIDDLGLIRILGEGQFGVVYLATADNICGNRGRSKVAVKMLKEGAQKKDIEDFQLELDIMMKIKPHPNVVRFLGCCSKKGPRCIILEFLANGNLLTFLRKSRGYDDTSVMDVHTSTLTSRQLIEFSFMIANGMNHLASNNIVHRDLACRNVLVDHKFRCKVSDLGLARPLDNASNIYKREKQARLPVKWMAYESIFEGISTLKSDVWSFGIVLYEIFTIGDIPYPEHKSKDVIKLIEQGYRMQKPLHCSDELFQLMTRCWEKNPSRRPTFGKLKSSLEYMFKQNDHIYLNMDKYNDELYINFQLNEDDDDVRGLPISTA